MGQILKRNILLLYALSLILSLPLFANAKSSSSSSSSSGSCPIPEFTAFATLSSEKLLDGNFTAIYNVVLSNPSKDQWIDSIRVTDFVQVEDNVIENLSATVSFSSDPIIPVNNVLVLPPIDSIGPNSDFEFTLTLNMSLDPGKTVHLTQRFCVDFRIGICPHEFCFNVETSAKEDECEFIPLELSDTTPTIISKPGNYRVVNSPSMQVTGATIANPNSTIIITSSDVVLDLCGNVLTGSGNKTGALVNDTRVDTSIGISINGSFANRLDNIKIKNGKLQFYSKNAISADYTSNLFLEDLLIENNTSVLINFTLLNSQALLDAAVLINANPGVAAAPDPMSTGFYHTNVHYKNNHGDISIIRCQNILISNSTVVGSRGQAAENQLSLPQAADFGVILQSCRFQRASGVVVDGLNLFDIQSLVNVFGIYFFALDTGLSIKNCNVSNVTQVAVDITPYIIAPFTTSVEVRGISVEVISSFFSVEDCNVQNVTGNVRFFNPQSTATNIPFANTRVLTCAGFLFERETAKFVRNCNSRFIRSAGLVHTRPEDGPLDSVLTSLPAFGFYNVNSQADFLTANLQENAQFIDCTAVSIDGGFTTSASDSSPAYGFANSNLLVTAQAVGADGTKSFATIFENCHAQDVSGSAESAGFGIIFLKIDPPNRTPFNPVTYINCTSQFDNLHNPTKLSNGFFTTARGNDIIFRDCNASGHTLHGYNLSGYIPPLPDPNTVGNAKFILDNCIANDNTGHGFYLDPSLRQVELVNCKSTNNSSNGFFVGGRDIVFDSCIANLNRLEGFFFDQFFPFVARVATDTSLTNLNIYQPAGFTITYVSTTPNGNPTGAFAQFLEIVPNDKTQAPPPFLLINGVQVVPGDTILVKDQTGTDVNTGATRNGVYQVSIQPRIFTVGGVTFNIPIYVLTRVNPWRAPNTIPAGTKILVTLSNAPNLTPGPVMYTVTNNVIVDTTAPTFSATLAIAPDPSRIALYDSKAVFNGSNGVHNRAKDVVVRKNVADRNGGIGFLDDSIGGAKANANLYSRNKAFNNDAGTILGNFTIDYVVAANPSVLQTGALNSTNANPVQFPSGVGAPEANISITP